MSSGYHTAERLRFLGLDEETRKTLTGLNSVIEKKLKGVLDDFYEEVRKEPEVSRMFSNDGHMTQARDAQIKHWMNILSGRFDDDYIASVRRIGETHHRIELEPRWYIAGYSHIICGVIEVLNEHFSSRFGDKNRKARIASVQAFIKAALLDMDFAISIYLDEGKKEKDRALKELSNGFEASIGGVVDAVSAATTELEATAGSMSSIADQTGERANIVSSAAEEAATNVQTVAAAAEELSSSIAEIGSQVDRSTERARSAVTEAENANGQVKSLAEAAEKINEVTSLIQDIAEQTNLLALNATIEAARAGDAGKGFAVVAQEVKSLASQTAKATQDIGQHIARVQSETEEAVSAIASISTAIEGMNEVTTAISAAIEEQGAAAQEIARNVNEAARGTQEVTSNIVGVSEGASQTGEASSEVVTAVGELARQSTDLKDRVHKFLEEVQAA